MIPPARFLSRRHPRSGPAAGAWNQPPVRSWMKCSILRRECENSRDGGERELPAGVKQLCRPDQQQDDDGQRQGIEALDAAPQQDRGTIDPDDDRGPEDRSPSAGRRAGRPPWPTMQISGAGSLREPGRACRTTRSAPMRMLRCIPDRLIRCRSPVFRKASFVPRSMLRRSPSSRAWIMASLCVSENGWPSSPVQRRFVSRLRRPIQRPGGRHPAPQSPLARAPMPPQRRFAASDTRAKLNWPGLVGSSNRWSQQYAWM